jgi:quinol monooxygenase YgiN
MINKAHLPAAVAILFIAMSPIITQAKTAEAVTAITYIDAIPDVFVPNNEEKAQALLKQMNSDSQKDPGLIYYTVLQESARPNHFTILETWTDDAAFSAHQLAAHTREFRNALQLLIGSPYDTIVTKSIK